ncbi:uncharacterized protein [Prorops nasuta]
MLQQGHEGELCSWLKEMSLIRTNSNCPHDDCTGRTLTWNPARIVDKYIWLCPGCSRKQPIRDGSFFFSIKCDLKMCLQSILGWCQSMPIDNTASALDVKKHVVKKIYNRCDEIAESYVYRHPEDWVLGKQGAILIVDEFPGGYIAKNLSNNTTNKKRNNNCHTIICIVEANTFPPKTWFTIVQAATELTKEERAQFRINSNNIGEKVLKEIINHIQPGSYIVANNQARYCNYDNLSTLRQYKVFSVEQLQRFDPPGTTKLINNLATIWHSSANLCSAVQETNFVQGQKIISNNLWRQRFGTSPSIAFEHILNHIAEYYKFS